MRDPDNIHNPSMYLEDNGNIIKINELPEFDIEDYDLFDEKDFKKYIDSIEKIVRDSFEYRQFIAYLRDYLDMNKCSFYSNVNNIDSFKIKIEIHHEPITLYDIAIVVYRKRAANNESLEEELVAKEVMYLHYTLSVGLIPLAETVHELVHNQYLFVPTSKVLGFYREFVDAYREYFLPEQLETLEKIEEASLSFNDDYKTLLARNYIYVDCSGAYELPKMEDVVNMMKNRIADIKQNPNNQSNLIIPAYFEEYK